MIQVSKLSTSCQFNDSFLSGVFLVTEAATSNRSSLEQRAFVERVLELYMPVVHSAVSYSCSKRSAR